MKMQNKKTEKLIKSAISNLIERETREWPPKCLSFAYQPMRPCKTDMTKTSQASMK